MSAKHNYFAVSLLLILVTIVMACQTQPTPTGPALTATLKELTGKVDIEQPGAKDYSPASLGMILQPSGSIETGSDGRARLDLSTGTIIRVSPSSVFTLTSNQPSDGSLSTQLNLTIGRIFIILKGGNLSVNTPSGVASVRGSYLSVYVDPNTLDVYVTCLEGNCGASNAAGSVNFGTGQKTLLFHCDATTGQCSVPTIGSMTPDDFQNWLNENPEVKPLIQDAYATLTALAPPPTEPPATEPPATEPPTATPTPIGGLGCLNVTSPDASSNLDPVGPAVFSWDAKEGASSYKLTIIYPDGGGVSFYTDGTSITRYAESMPAGGNYSWNITAYDSAGNKICQTSDGSFSKPQYVKPKPKVPGCIVGQWNNPNAPCYCGNFQYPATPPPWCPPG